MRHLFLTILLLPMMATAESAFEQQITHNGKTLSKVGEAELGFLWYTAYDSALWAPNANYEPEKIHAVELQYDMNFSEQELIDESIKQLKKIGQFSQVQLQGWREDLKTLNLSVKPGDAVRMIAVPGEQLVFIKNGVQIGTFSDAELSRNYLQIWLGENSEYPKVTRQLKGL